MYILSELYSKKETQLAETQGIAKIRDAGAKGEKSRNAQRQRKCTKRSKASLTLFLFYSCAMNFCFVIRFYQD